MPDLRRLRPGQTDHYSLSPYALWCEHCCGAWVRFIDNEHRDAPTRVFTMACASHGGGAYIPDMYLLYEHFNPLDHFDLYTLIEDIIVKLESCE